MFCSPSSPDHQVALGSLQEIWHIGAISTHFTHEWRVLWIAVPYLYIIWCRTIFKAANIHNQEFDVYIGSNGLRDEVDAVRIFWVAVWIWWWGDKTICSCETATTCSNAVGPLWSLICDFIFKLEPMTTLSIVGYKSVNKILRLSFH